MDVALRVGFWYGMVQFHDSHATSDYPFFLSFVQHVHSLCLTRIPDAVFALLLDQRPICLKPQAAHGQLAPRYPTLSLQTGAFRSPE